MQYDRTVIAYHGCDALVAERLLAGEAFSPSENDYDWLGHGIYFWEWGVDRAWRFAQVQKTRGKVQTPAVVGAVIQLGQCFDLMDTRFTHDLAAFFEDWKAALAAAGRPHPQNKGGPPDWKGRYLDCAVINAYLESMATTVGKSYDTVRCGFVEGEPVFEGAGFRMESHVQLAVRNEDAIVGVFRPNLRRAT